MTPIRTLASLIVLGMFVGTAAAQTTSPPRVAAADRYAGEITGNDVYVRSGPSKNYYAVLKLNAGNRVTVVGEESGWLAIAPPAGAFSLIDGNFVDRGDGKHGVVNGSVVNVRAGSTLATQKYAVQVKLKKGAGVEIIEPADEGFLKIVPPEGAKLWVSKEFVARLPGDPGEPNVEVASAAAHTGEKAVDGASADSPRTSASADSPAPSQPPGSAMNESAPSGEAANSGAARSARPDAAPAKTKAASKVIKAQDVKVMRAAVEQIDKELGAEMQKAVTDRRLAPLIERFRPFAEQSDDEFSRLYARQRITQMERLGATIDAAREVKQLAQTVQDERRNFAAARDLIKPPRTLTPAGFHAEGELRSSAVYDSPLGPKRYRLVDPAGTVPRTLCYLEFPAESNAHPNDCLGRKVGIRAAGRRPPSGDVDPVPIYVVSEMVLLNGAPDAASDASAGAIENGTASSRLPSEP